jgi:hypothetical protein
MYTKALQSRQFRVEDVEPGHGDKGSVFGGPTVLGMPKHLGVNPVEPPSDSFWPETTYSDPAVRPANMQAEDIMMEDQWSSMMCDIDVIMGDARTHTQN